MFKEMRRSTKLMNNDEAKKILQEEVYGTLATIGAKGYPHSIPLNYVYENDAIYFHSAPEGLKIDNIKFNNKVAFSVVTGVNVLPEKFYTEFASVVVYGQAVEIADEEEKRRVLSLLINKYSDKFVEKGEKYINARINKVAVFKINIEHMSGKNGR